jgi:hypothetical protein
MPETDELVSAPLAAGAVDTSMLISLLAYDISRAGNAARVVERGDDLKTHVRVERI